MISGDQPWILVVDDDRDICHNLTDILTDLGYNVESAQDGFSALEIVRRQPFDVALLDLKMPGMDGLTLFREIKKQRPETVVLLVTAYAGPTVVEEALTAGAWKVVPKPVDFRRLLQLVDEAIEQPLVLIVDDDHDLCTSLWDLLRERGYRVGLAHNGQEVAERLRDSKFHVALIDLRIPDSDGEAVFRMVRDANPNAHTILITGYRSEMDSLIGQIMAEGADAVCYKPFNIPELLGVLEHLTATDPPAGRELAS
jgi:DNA-binding NtrC family response regulator